MLNQNKCLPIKNNLIVGATLVVNAVNLRIFPAVACVHKQLIASAGLFVGHKRWRIYFIFVLN
jgi:hypothetical protein